MLMLANSGTQQQRHNKQISEVDSKKCLYGHGEKAEIFGPAQKRPGRWEMLSAPVNHTRTPRILEPPMTERRNKDEEQIEVADMRMLHFFALCDAIPSPRTNKMQS